MQQQVDVNKQQSAVHSYHAIGIMWRPGEGRRPLLGRHNEEIRRPPWLCVKMAASVSPSQISMGLGLIDLLMLRTSFRNDACAPFATGLDIENPANDSAMRGGSVGIDTGGRMSDEVLRLRRDVNVGEVGEWRAIEEMGAQGVGATIRILCCEGRRVTRLSFGGEHVSFADAVDERREEIVEVVCSEIVSAPRRQTQWTCFLALTTCALSAFTRLEV
ncbi:hypothetical protein SCHPADRAFT_398021 [Schizopora paradoxa]|uniref:Uncharacterized protein n=1 Tax=Schizopora paradoxa TaxID=27342 RepID=A0A0H2RTQ2_9AGAM|nr:hypothetical protein SCHPADRAFT_398021 [Schizopora paradoxa]